MPSVNNSLVQAGTDWVLGATPSKTTTTKGVPNPYGLGASAYEPNTQVHDPATDPLFTGSQKQLTGTGEIEKEQADAAKAAADTTTANAGAPGTSVPTGSVLNVINAAKKLLGKPYVWGGTSINGVDCSGLLYFAFNAAGIKVPRYRASDWGKLGQQVGADQARAGDVVYWDEPGATDHVGLYLGDGMVLQSPQSGDVTKISHVWGKPVYRRVLNDDQFGTMMLTPTITGTSYGGQSATSVFHGSTPIQVPTGVSVATTVPELATRLPTTGFKVRAE